MGGSVSDLLAQLFTLKLGVPAQRLMPCVATHQLASAELSNLWHTSDSYEFPRAHPHSYVIRSIYAVRIG
jgi:hypothetical protein